MRKRCIALALVAAAVAAAALIAWRAHGQGLPAGVHPAEAHRLPRIWPDYEGITIPPNIAPLNFVIKEPGRRRVVRVSGKQGTPFEVAAADGSVEMPMGPWRALLAANRGGDIALDVTTQGAGGGWTHFDTLRQHVASEEVDSHLVYRLLRPAYNKWGYLGIFQRDLTSFDESPILQNRSVHKACLNCHTFLKNQPDTFLLQVRPADKGNPAMVVVQGGKARKVDTRAPGRPPGSYSAWHPSGKMIAFSAAKIRQYFHTAGPEPRDVVDVDSDLGFYWTESGKVTSDPATSRPDRLETFPTWSPDGKTLFFASAPRVGGPRAMMRALEVPKVQYDLMRVSFDPDTGKWGRPETVLAARDYRKSILEPRVSPDGRFLLVTMCDYGAFPVMQQHSDLYLLDLNHPDARARRLDPGPESQRDSWHCWSSSGRWIVYSHKMDFQVMARPYLRYIDAAGNAAKPFVVPQRDPGYYLRCIFTYNAPELATGRVTATTQALAPAINGQK